MSIKSKVLATAASLTLVGGVLAVSTLAAGTAAKAETPSCGSFNIFCVDLFSKQFGTHHDPGFIQDVYRQGNRVGQKIILFRISSGDPAEDFTIDDLLCFTTTASPLKCENGSGALFTVSDLQTISGGTLFNPITAAQYADSSVVEFEYAPFGVNSGLCTGIAAAPFNGEGVTLQPCGLTARTLWIINSNNPIFAFVNGFTSLINGANQNFSHPFVLTYPTNGFPTDLPRPQLQVHQVQTFSQGFPFIVTNQLWGADFGTIPGT